ncbi:MBL fold metallo-hydrolase [Paraflavitalea speifideaquila]|uniref:MBL fold metallo-hydrolase n=1 Tax=Paraflavitalea speifideaquila TaxID=3076558 RepID=UPI003312FD5D
MTYLTEGSYKNLPVTVDLQTFSVKGTRITRYLHQGDKIDLGGRTLTVHPTPGETPGAISLYDDLHHIFFTGDLLHPGGIWLHQKNPTGTALYNPSISCNPGHIPYSTFRRHTMNIV